MSHFVIIGLGSNLGNREQHLKSAIHGLSPWVEGIKESCVYSSPAMLPKSAPKEWDIPFLNMAICGKTTLSVDQLLKRALLIEEELGRKRIGHWGPREIDVDILAYDDLVMDSQHLRIPHPGILERAFVLLPMQDVAPGWVYPRPSIYEGRTIQDIAREVLGNNHQCKLFKTELTKDMA